MLGNTQDGASTRIQGVHDVLSISYNVIMSRWCFGPSATSNSNEDKKLIIAMERIPYTRKTRSDYPSDGLGIGRFVRHHYPGPPTSVGCQICTAHQHPCRLLLGRPVDPEPATGDKNNILPMAFGTISWKMT